MSVKRARFTRLRTSPPAAPQGEVAGRVFAYLKRVLVDGDEAAGCEPETAAALAGMLAAQRVRVGMDVHGLSQEAALSQVLAWVCEQAALYGPETNETGDV